MTHRTQELLDKVQKELKQQVDFEVSEFEIQRLLANMLRELAISHLTISDKVVAKDFRGEYTHVENILGSYHQFIAQQRKPGVWATYVEATALAERFGCHLVVTPVKEGEEQPPICLYRAENDHAPTIHLYNHDNRHWSVNENTRGDGNCLYNAIAQALQQLAVKPALPNKTKPTWATRHPESISTVTPQHAEEVAPRTPRARVVNETKQEIDSPPPQALPQDHQYHIALDRQRQLFDTIIQCHPTPTQMKQELEAEHERIKQLPPTEQKQIRDDYQFALKLAMDECFVYDHEQMSSLSLK